MASTRRKRRNQASGSATLGMVEEAAAKTGDREWLRLEDGDSVELRIIDPDEDFKDAWCHRVKMETKDKTYHADVPCLDQKDEGIPCPGCKEGLKRSYKFWTNVIVRGDEDAKDAAGRKDRLMIWGGGITIAKRLLKLNKRIGLAKRDILVEREGSTMNDTKYDVEWATDENEPMDDDDRRLAEKKHDLSRYHTPPEYDDFFKPANERGNDDDDDDVGEESVRRGSAFKRRKKTEDEDDEPRKTTRRKKSGSLGDAKRKASSESSTTKKTTVRRRRSR